jgi:hypothetical protein
VARPHRSDRFHAASLGAGTARRGHGASTTEALDFLRRPRGRVVHRHHLEVAGLDRVRFVEALGPGPGTTQLPPMTTGQGRR